MEKPVPEVAPGPMAGRLRTMQAAVYAAEASGMIPPAIKKAVRASWELAYMQSEALAGLLKRIEELEGRCDG